jgi:hypothetical protein
MDKIFNKKQAKYTYQILYRSKNQQKTRERSLQSVQKHRMLYNWLRSFKYY